MFKKILLLILIPCHLAASGNNSNNENTFQSIVNKLSPFLNGLGPVAGLINEFHDSPNNTANMLDQLKKLHERLNKIEDKMDKSTRVVFRVKQFLSIRVAIADINRVWARWAYIDKSKCFEYDPENSLDLITRKITSEQTFILDYMRHLKDHAKYSVYEFENITNYILANLFKAYLLTQNCIIHNYSRVNNTKMLTIMKHHADTQTIKIEKVTRIIEKSIQNAFKYSNEERNKYYRLKTKINSQHRVIYHGYAGASVKRQDLITQTIRFDYKSWMRGIWSHTVYCAIGEYMLGYYVKKTPYNRLNGLTILCGDGKNEPHELRQFEIMGGDYKERMLCENGSFVNGINFNLENTNIYAICSINNVGSHGRGYTSASCSKFSKVCGFRTFIEADVSNEITRHFNVEFSCCKFEKEEQKELWIADDMMSQDAAIRGGGFNQNNNNNFQFHEPVKQPHRCDTKKLVGYFTSWGNNTLYYSQLKVLTHIIFAFIEMKSDGSLQFGSPDINNTINAEEDARKARNRLLQLLKARTRYPHLKISFAVGGWAGSGHFSHLVRSTVAFENFWQSVSKLFKIYDFDGIDIDWEYPVAGGAKQGESDEKILYVEFMRKLRSRLDGLGQRTNTRYTLTFAGAVGEWVIVPGFDLEKLLDIVDWVNVMSYDFYGAWDDKWGAFTGPPAPLFHGAPEGFSGKMNAHFGMQLYVCSIKNPSKIVMGVPFYGRYWNNVRAETIDGNDDDMWHSADAINGKFTGGVLTYKEIEKMVKLGKITPKFHNKTKTPYAFESRDNYFLGYEDPTSLRYKVDYANKHNLGGLMIWAIDYDTENLEMLRVIADSDFCSSESNEIKYNCIPFKEKRWWTQDSIEPSFAGMCGKSAPLINGFYPVCDPHDPGYSCCGQYGYCGGTEESCNCDTCIDYGGKDFNKLTQEPVKPKTVVKWYTMDAVDGKRGRCGIDIPKLLVNNKWKYAICNPDDLTNHCCSAAGHCGMDCECEGCIDFSKYPNYEFKEKTWYTYPNSNTGRCGPNAPLLNNKIAECDPLSKVAHCCSKWGWCGSGNDACECTECIDFKK